MDAILTTKQKRTTNVIEGEQFAIFNLNPFITRCHVTKPERGGYVSGAKKCSKLIDSRGKLETKENGNCGGDKLTETEEIGAILVSGLCTPSDRNPVAKSHRREGG